MPFSSYARRLWLVHKVDAEFVAVTLGIPALIASASVAWWAGSWIVFCAAVPLIYFGLVSLLMVPALRWLPTAIGSIGLAGLLGWVAWAVADKHLGGVLAKAIGVTVGLGCVALGVFVFRKLALRLDAHRE